MTTKILVYGWYGKNNIGDDLFISAFKKIFPEFEFIFVDKLTIRNVNWADVVFIGGGSFLYDAPKSEPSAVELLKIKPLFYIGVGSETGIHPIHVDLMERAKLIAIRNDTGFSMIKNGINTNTILIPDIVYSLKEESYHKSTLDKSVLILPNVTLVPQNSDPHWKFAAWEYFKSEFSQFLDALVEDNYQISFLSMCNNIKSCDHWAATEILTKMQYRDSRYLLPQVSGIKDIASIFCKYEKVITQRFHGIILSEMFNIPYLSLHHHDKLKPSNNNSGSFVSYYNINKKQLLDNFYSLTNNEKEILPIECDMFADLKNKVFSLISE